MTDGSTPHEAVAAPLPRGSALGLRLALAFISVALIAIALLAGLTAVFAARDVSSLAVGQHAELTSAIAAAAAAAWEQNDNWADADLSPVFDLAARTGADAQIRSESGTVVTSSPGYAAQPGPQYGAAIMVRGERVGETGVRFTGRGLASADHTLEIDLLRAIAGAAGLAALLAMLTGLGVSRRITRPVEQIIAVTRAVGRGQRAARVGTVTAPGELRELASAFDQMADTMDRQEQLRRDLVADVAHELRTPLAVLQAGHEALLDEITEPTPEQLASLRDEVLRLARMVTDLQTLAAADAAAGLRLSRHPCDLADITAAACSSLAGQFEAAGIAVHRSLATAEILGDPHWLHQVITNLLTNALKFTPAGGRVTIAAGPAGADAVLTVTDTGTGIPADELPRIFDRFWRGRQAAQISGSGIGLAVASELTRAQGGRLSASSQPGQGTEMTLTLPLAGGTEGGGGGGAR